MRVVSACLTAGLICVVTPAFAQAPKLVQKYDNWQVYVHESQGEKVCFAAASPKSMEPKTAKRGPVYLYLTTWQKDGVRNEVSVKIGYTLKQGSKPIAIVGKDQWELYPTDDKAFMRDPAEERKLLEAMKKGSTLTVKGTSARACCPASAYSRS